MAAWLGAVVMLVLSGAVIVPWGLDMFRYGVED